MPMLLRYLVALAIAPVLLYPTKGMAQDDTMPGVAEALPVASYPREFTGESGTVVVHTPQIDSWEDFETVTARAAIEVTPAGDEEATFGVVEFAADTDPNLELRVVAVENVKFSAMNFSGESDERAAELKSVFSETVEPRTQYVPLDVVLSYIAPDATVPAAQGLSFEPPPIFYSETPAKLLITDGEPLLAPIDDTKLKYAVNTNWDLLQYKDKEWYLRDGKQWLKARHLSDKWKYDSSLPRDFKKLPDDGNWTDTKAAVPPEKTDQNPPMIFVSERPAELIVTDGPPRSRSVGGPGLKYVSNTEADLFTYESNYYYLVSGRWFRAGQLRGPWEHQAELPDAFARIPSDNDKGHVLAAVPNTDEARLAVLEATLPRKASVSRNAGNNVSVFYDGQPTFENIPGTDVFRATNSPQDVLRVANLYYLCDSAVWFVSESPTGPWTVADLIPPAVYSIPASSPSYHVTHVHVYESDNDSVQTGYTSGYFGMTVAFGVAMYGTGYYYSPYHGYYGYGYPYYYPYPYSYGGGSWYNPNTGMYGRSQSVYGPYGGYGRSASYNPETGSYARGRAVWDGDEIAGQGYAYNPRTGTGVATNRYSKDYKGWGESLVTHNDKWLATQSEWNKNSISTDYTTSRGGSGTLERERAGDAVYGSGEFQRNGQSLSTESVRYDSGAGAVKFEGGDGQTGAIVRSEEGDLYAGKNGEVYQRGDDGWYQHNDGNWDKVEVPDDRAAAIDERRNEATTRNPDGVDRSQAADSLSQRQQSGSSSNQAARQQQLSNRGFADSGNMQNRQSQRSYDTSRMQNRSFDTSRQNELNRSYNARSSGYERYNSRGSAGSMNRGSGQRSRAAPRRRRR